MTLGLTGAVMGWAAALASAGRAVGIEDLLGATGVAFRSVLWTSHLTDFDEDGQPLPTAPLPWPAAPPVFPGADPRAAAGAWAGAELIVADGQPPRVELTGPPPPWAERERLREAGCRVGLAHGQSGISALDGARYVCGRRAFGAALEVLADPNPEGIYGGQLESESTERLDRAIAGALGGLGREVACARAAAALFLEGWAAELVERAPYLRAASGGGVDVRVAALRGAAGHYREEARILAPFLREVPLDPAPLFRAAAEAEELALRDLGRALEAPSGVTAEGA